MIINQARQCPHCGKNIIVQVDLGGPDDTSVDMVAWKLHPPEECRTVTR